MYPQNKTPIILIVLGLFIISILQIINHFLTLSDYLNGILNGIGITIMLIALKIIHKINTANK